MKHLKKGDLDSGIENKNPITLSCGKRGTPINLDYIDKIKTYPPHVTPEMRNELEDSVDIESNEESHNIYDNQHSYDYHCWNASSDENDSGLAFMVEKAITGTMNGHRYMETYDILLHLLVARFTATLTVDQRNIFYLILEIIMRKTEKQKRNENKTLTKDFDKSETNEMEGQFNELLRVPKKYN